MASSVAIAGDKEIPAHRLKYLADLCQAQQYSAEIAVDYLLYQSIERLELRSVAKTNIGSVFVDFVDGKAKHRRLQGGGKGQQIAKAIGLNKFKAPTVLDTTAGLGRDAFVLATLGCNMTLLERSPIIFALLEDGLKRAKRVDQSELSEIIERMHLLQIDAISYLEKLSDKPDVLYIDPMFPERQKKAQVKKEMRFFHDVVGKDMDSVELLELARTKAKRRIVVKRPRLAEALGNSKANFSISGKSTRYDVYLPI